MHPAYSATRKQITILGINSLFGKAVSFLLKQSPIANRLVLYDECNTEMAYDLSEINTTCKVVVYNGEAQLGCALKNSDLILIGDKEDPGPNVEETISKSAPDLIKYAEVISCSAPNAIVLVAAYPVNSMMSLFSEVQLRNGTFDCDRVMGVTSVDTMRASTVLARHLNLDPEKVYLPVIGGSSPDTRIPLFSQSRPALTACKADLRKMTRMVKMSECELFKLLNRGDAMNKAYATVRLMTSVMSALGGQRNISEIVLSRTCVVPDVDYFSLPVILGRKGIAHRFPIPTLTERENILLDNAIKFIQVDKQKAVDIMCSSAKFHRSPEKTKEYSDLLECDKKGIFVGAILDRLRIRKEACKPKLEYLLMCKNDTVYPPDFEPSIIPKRIQFVEPDIVLNDGCCPVKLPLPPSPPKRGLNVIAPKRSKCKVESSPCPYPPVVKLPKTCRICEKGRPCELFEDCKSLYGDTKCCRKPLPQPDNRSLSSPKQSAQSLPADDHNKQVVGLEIDRFERTPDTQCCPKSTTSNATNHSIPYAGLDNVEAKSIKETLPTVNASTNISSGNSCPYGMSVNPTAFGYDQTSLTSKLRSEETIPKYLQNATKGTTAENVRQIDPSRISTKHQEPSRLHSDCSTHHSYSAPSQSQELQNYKYVSNQEMVIQHGVNQFSKSAKQGLESTEVNNQTEPMLHSFPPSTQSEEHHKPKSTPNQGTVIHPGVKNFGPEANDGHIESNDISQGSARRTLDQSIDHCLSKICLVEIDSAKVPPPVETWKVAATASLGVSDMVTNNQSISQLATSAKAPEPHTRVQNSAQYNTTASPISDASVPNTSKVQAALHEQVNNSVGPTSTTSVNYNYSGGLGLPLKPVEGDVKTPLVNFNPWSSRKEEQYYNEHSGTNARLKKVSDKEGTVSPVLGDATLNENSIGKSKAIVTENMEHPNDSRERKPSVWNTPEQRAVGMDSKASPITLGTKLLKRTESAWNDNETKSKNNIIPDLASVSSETENKIVEEGLWKDLGINTLSEGMRSQKNMKARIEDVRKQKSQRNVEKTKILGFGQMINKLIPTTSFVKKTETKSNISPSSSNSNTVLQKLYVETHSNLLTTNHKENQGSVMMPVSSKDNDEKTNKAKIEITGSRTDNIRYSELSKIAHIKSRVQEALKSAIFPPKYSGNPIDRVVKNEKQIERILQEKLRRASKAINYNVREVRKVEPAHVPASQKQYAPKCPSRLMFGSQPDCRVITFNNVREFTVPKVVAAEKTPRSAIVNHTLKLESSEVEESTEKPTALCEKQTTENYLPVPHNYVVQNNATDSDKPNPSVNEHPYYWDHKPHAYAYQVDLSPALKQEYVQNQPASIQLKSATALPISSNEYWKQVIEQHTLRENRNEAALNRLEYVIKQKSKKAITPGSARLARMNDPKYGMTSPNRLRFN